MKAGFYEFGPEGSNNIIWVVGAEVENGGYEVGSSDDWATCFPVRYRDEGITARRVGDAPTTGDYNTVINRFIAQRSKQ